MLFVKLLFKVVPPGTFSITETTSTLFCDSKLLISKGRGCNGDKVMKLGVACRDGNGVST